MNKHSNLVNQETEIQILINRNMLDEANKLLIKLLEINKENYYALIQIGVISAMKGNYQVAIEYFENAIKINKRDCHSHNNLGNIYIEIGEYEKAKKAFDRSIKLNPKFTEGYFNKARLFEKIGQYKFAIDNYEMSIMTNSRYVSSFINLGVVYIKISEFEKAIGVLDRALSLVPESLEALCNRGVALGELKYYEAAVKSFEQAIRINPKYYQTYKFLGILQCKKGEVDAAIMNFNIALGIEPAIAELYSNIGNAFLLKKQIENALLAYQKAINLDEKYADAYINMGNALNQLGRHADAVDKYIHGIEIEPSADAYFNLANTYFELKQFDEALDYFEKTKCLNSNYPYLLGKIHHVKMHMSNWENYSENVNQLLSAVKLGGKAAESFETLSMIDCPFIHQMAASSFVNENIPENLELGGVVKKSPVDMGGKLKIGYYSADFRDHPVSYLTAELFEKHDKSKYEIIGFYFGPPCEDNMHKRIKNSFEKFLDIRLMDDKTVAQVSREIGIDIAVDLTGHTAKSRVGIFSYRAAPIQISYLGYLGTMGAKYFDYLVADPAIIPDENQIFYNEKIIYLPSYQVNDGKRKSSDRIFTREELGLHESDFVYCCLNNSYKITPNIFDCWVKILQFVENSVLFLYSDNSFSEENLKKEAQRRGLSPGRIIFGPRMDYADYLARYNVFDLFLDTNPYNAGTTASDALWSGVPVLTLIGESFQSRVAASLLMSIDLPELIAKNQDEYVNKAIQLAKYPSEYNKLKDKLIHNIGKTDLFNCTVFTKNIEKAYSLIHGNYLDNISHRNIHT